MEYFKFNYNIIAASTFIFFIVVAHLAAKKNVTIPLCLVAQIRDDNA